MKNLKNYKNYRSNFPINLIKTKRLGIFDSGIGGLAILESIKNIDCEHIIYIADTANLPYGDKQPHHIIAATYLIVQKLCMHQVDTIIIACHTASAIALDFLQDQFPEIQFISIVELMLQAITKYQLKNVCLLATQATVNSGIYKKKLETYGITIQSIACPQLVPAIEMGADEKTLTSMLVDYLSSIDLHPDAFLLGCTHYDMLYGIFKRLLPEIMIISAPHILQNNVTLTNNPALISYYATGIRPSKFPQ
jgi:glutamate racemase